MCVGCWVVLSLIACRTRRAVPYGQGALGEVRGKGDPVEAAAGVATSWRAWSASPGCAYSASWVEGSATTSNQAFIPGLAESTGNLVEVIRGGASLSHSGEENSRSGLSLAGKGQQPRSPGDPGLHSRWALAAAAVRSAEGWLGARAGRCWSAGPAPPPVSFLPSVFLAYFCLQHPLQGEECAALGRAVLAERRHPGARSGPPGSAVWRCATCFDRR